jgi:hypothetical protein
MNEAQKSFDSKMNRLFAVRLQKHGANFYLKGMSGKSSQLKPA